MFDFGVLPPEINSARMYTGPGSGPMMAAAAAWDALTAQLETFAARYSAVVSELHGQSWSGASSAAMVAAAAPYVAWVSATAVQAGQSASQARAAAAGYEAAFSATVPPFVVAANRAQLMLLVATNFFGQNTPAIAANEIAYAEMWAQDAVAMYTYAATASSATALSPFEQPPQTTNPAGSAAQAAVTSDAVESAAGQSATEFAQLLAAVPQQLQGLASAGAGNAVAADATTSPIIAAFETFNILTGPLVPAYQIPFATFQAGLFVTQLTESKVESQLLPALAAPLDGAAAQAALESGQVQPVLAGAGRAVSVGGLSTPPNWTLASQNSAAVEPVEAAEPAVRVLPPWAQEPASAGHTGVPAMAPLNNAGARRGDNTVFRMRDRRYRMPRPAPGG